MVEDAYQVQLTNGPAEELAEILVKSGKGAFAQCGFVSGGKTEHISMSLITRLNVFIHRLGSYGGGYEACTAGSLIVFHKSLFLTILSSTSTRQGKGNERTSSPGSYPITVTHSEL